MQSAKIAQLMEAGAFVGGADLDPEVIVRINHRDSVRMPFAAQTTIVLFSKARAP
jgi:hypothetical protein